MPSLECKNCKKTIAYQHGETLCRCEACGTIQDIPQTLREAGDIRLNDTVLSQIPTENPDAKNIFSQIANFEEPEILEEDTLSSDAARKNGIYYSALSKMGGVDTAYYQQAIAEFETIRGWKDTDELIARCERKIKQLDEEEAQLRRRFEAQRKKHKRLYIIGIPAVSVLLVLALVFIFVLLPSGKYNRALSLEQEGNVVQAYELFDSLRGYKDSPERAKALFERYKVQKLPFAEPGEYIYFGNYEQDNNPDNGKEDIEWLVLEKEGDSLLLISRYAMDCQSYYTEHEAINWENSSLRKWLNGEFYQAAFNSTERAQLLTSDVHADANPDFGSDPGNNTQDHVFLLSINEANRYFTDNAQRRCHPTEYAKAQGVKQDSKHLTCCWYLRSPGFDETMLAYVQFAGDVRTFGCFVNAVTGAVRPAVRIQIHTETAQ